MKKNTRILTFGIILCMLFSLAVVPANAASSGTCGDNLTWTLDNEGTLTISGTGNMREYSTSSSIPWNSSLTTIKNAVIEDGVTSICKYAFYKCSNLEQVSIPSGVTSIGDYAFRNCSSLTSLIIPEGVTAIGNSICRDCSALRSVTIPEGIPSLPSQSFYNCASLTSVTIPNSVTSIGSSAFYNCSNLRTVTLGEGVTSIGEGAFAYCEKLYTITIGIAVTSIRNRAFDSCNRLSEVFYYGNSTQWNKISIGGYNTYLTNAPRYYNNTYIIPNNVILDIGEDLNYRNRNVNTAGSHIISGNKKITGSLIRFTSEGKMRLDNGYTAKVEEDNGNGTTNQGFMAGMTNPKGVVSMVLDVTGTVDETDYTGRTITKAFDFTDYEIEGLVNFGFTVNNIPKPLNLTVKSVN